MRQMKEAFKRVLKIATAIFRVFLGNQNKLLELQLFKQE